MSASFKELPLFFWRFSGQPMRFPAPFQTPKTFVGSLKSKVEGFSSKFLIASEISKRFPEKYFTEEFPNGVGYALGRFSQDLALASREGSLASTQMQDYMSSPLYRQIHSEWEELRQTHGFYPLLKFTVKDAIPQKLSVRAGPTLQDLTPKFMYWDEDLCGAFYKLNEKLILMRKPDLEFVVSSKSFDENNPVDAIVQSYSFGRTLKVKVEVVADVVGGLFDNENNERPPLRNLNREFVLEFEAFRKSDAADYGSWKLSDIDYLIENRFN